MTIILLPLGIPLLGVARRMMAAAVRMMLPRAVAHPVKESRKGLRKRSGDTASKAASAIVEGARRGKKNAKAATEEIGKKAKRKRKPWWRRLL